MSRASSFSGAEREVCLFPEAFEGAYLVSARSLPVAEESLFVLLRLLSFLVCLRLGRY